MVREQLSSADAEDDDTPASGAHAAKQKAVKQYVIDVDPNPTEAERAVLRDKVDSKAIDGYLWLSDDAIAAGKVTWASRNMAGFTDRSRLSQELSGRLHTRGSPRAASPPIRPASCSSPSKFRPSASNTVRKPKTAAERSSWKSSSWSC